MKALLDAIVSKFSATGSLTTAFPGGLFPGIAPAGTAMPFAVYSEIAAPREDVYGQAAFGTVQLQFSAHGIGHAAVLQAAETLNGVYRDTILTLAGGQNFDSRQISEPVGQWQGRDDSAADDANSGDAWMFATDFQFSTRTP